MRGTTPPSSSAAKPLSVCGWLVGWSVCLSLHTQQNEEQEDRGPQEYSEIQKTAHHRHSFSVCSHHASAIRAADASCRVLLRARRSPILARITVYYEIETHDAASYHGRESEAF